MIVALEEKYGASPEAMVLDAFSAFDVNGDGNVSREELKEVRAVCILAVRTRRVRCCCRRQRRRFQSHAVRSWRWCMAGT